VKKASLVDNSLGQGRMRRFDAGVDDYDGFACAGVPKISGDV
jgi:hypothetical protein